MSNTLELITGTGENGDRDPLGFTRSFQPMKEVTASLRHVKLNDGNKRLMVGLLTEVTISFTTSYWNCREQTNTVYFHIGEK